MRQRILPLLALLFSAGLLHAENVKEIKVRQGGHFITRPEEGDILVSDNPVTGFRTVRYKTPSLDYEYVIDREFRLVSYRSNVNDPKLAGIFMASEVVITRTETGYTYRKKRGQSAWEEIKLPVSSPVIYFGGMSNFLQEKLKAPGSLPEKGLLTCLIPPFLPLDIAYTLKRTTSDKIPLSALPVTKGQPPEHFIKFQSEARPIWLAEFKLTGLAWLFYPHGFYFALEDDAEPELLANWGGRTDTEDYFIVYTPAGSPVNAVLK